MPPPTFYIGWRYAFALPIHYTPLPSHAALRYIFDSCDTFIAVPCGSPYLTITVTFPLSLPIPHILPFVCERACGLCAVLFGWTRPIYAPTVTPWYQPFPLLTHPFCQWFIRYSPTRLGLPFGCVAVLFAFTHIGDVAARYRLPRYRWRLLTRLFALYYPVPTDAFWIYCAPVPPRFVCRRGHLPRLRAALLIMLCVRVLAFCSYHCRYTGPVSPLCLVVRSRLPRPAIRDAVYHVVRCSTFWCVLPDSSGLLQLYVCCCLLLRIRRWIPNPTLPSYSPTNVWFHCVCLRFPHLIGCWRTLPCIHVARCSTRYTVLPVQLNIADCTPQFPRVHVTPFWFVWRCVTFSWVLHYTGCTLNILLTGVCCSRVGSRTDIPGYALLPRYSIPFLTYAVGGHFFLRIPGCCVWTHCLPIVILLTDSRFVLPALLWLFIRIIPPVWRYCCAHHIPSQGYWFIVCVHEHCYRLRFPRLRLFSSPTTIATGYGYYLLWYNILIARLRLFMSLMQLLVRTHLPLFVGFAGLMPALTRTHYNTPLTPPFYLFNLVRCCALVSTWTFSLTLPDMPTDLPFYRWIAVYFPFTVCVGRCSPAIIPYLIIYWLLHFIPRRVCIVYIVTRSLHFTFTYLFALRRILLVHCCCYTPPTFIRCAFAFVLHLLPFTRLWAFSSDYASWAIGLNLPVWLFLVNSIRASPGGILPVSGAFSWFCYAPIDGLLPFRIGHSLLTLPLLWTRSLLHSFILFYLMSYISLFFFRFSWPLVCRYYYRTF